MKIKRFKNYITWENKQGHFNTECNRASLEDDLSLTIPTTDMTKVALARERESKMSLRIRKLVPLETCKLMGFSESDYQAMRDIGMSDSQIYHCCGDSIVTTVLMGLFGTMLPISEETLNQCIKDYAESLRVE